MSLEAHMNEQKFREDAQRLASAIRNFATARRLSVAGNWPETGVALRVTQDGSRAWLELKALEPSEKGQDTRPAFRIQHGLGSEEHVFACDCRFGWTLLAANKEAYQGIRLKFREDRGGFEVTELYAVIEPLMLQVFEGWKDARAHYARKGVAAN